MKKSTVLITLVATLLLVGCKKESGLDSSIISFKGKSFDTSLIPGKWVTGTEYWKFDEAGSGKYWDSADDVTEEEANQCWWSVSGDVLTITIVGEMGQQVPKEYTIKELTNTTFRYSDAYGKEYRLTRVE